MKFFEYCIASIIIIFVFIGSLGIAYIIENNKYDANLCAAHNMTYEEGGRGRNFCVDSEGKMYFFR
jgi:hypothetical protein